MVDDKVQKDRFAGEYEILVKYESLNRLAAALYDDGVLNEAVAKEFRAIHHLKQDIAFYLTDLLNALSPTQIYAVLATESLGREIERVLGVSEPQKIHENRSATPSFKMLLSDVAQANLRVFLRADFACLDRLAELNAITPEAHKRLTE